MKKIEEIDINSPSVIEQYNLAGSDGHSEEPLEATRCITALAKLWDNKRLLTDIQKEVKNYGKQK